MKWLLIKRSYLLTTAIVTLWGTPALSTVSCPEMKPPPAVEPANIKPFLNSVDRVEDKELLDLVELEVRDLLRGYQYDDSCRIIRVERKTESQGMITEMQQQFFYDEFNRVSQTITDGTTNGVRTVTERFNIQYDPRFGEVIQYNEIKKDEFGITTTIHFEQELNDLGLPSRIHQRVHEEGDFIDTDGAIVPFDRTIITEKFDFVYEPNHMIQQYRERMIGSHGMIFDHEVRPLYPNETKTP